MSLSTTASDVNLNVKEKEAIAAAETTAKAVLLTVFNSCQEEGAKRVTIYANYDIGWVSLDGFKHTGCFMKASNMNCGLRLPPVDKATIFSALSVVRLGGNASERRLRRRSASFSLGAVYI